MIKTAFSKIDFVGIGENLLIASAMLLLVRRNELPWPIKRISEILLVFSLLTTIGAILKDNLWIKARAAITLFIKPFSLIIAGVLLATALSFVRYGIAPDKEGIVMLLRFLTVMAMAIMIKFYADTDPAFLSRKIYWVLLIPLIWLPAIFLSPDFLHLTGIAPNYGKFRGLDNFPSNAGYMFLIAFAVIFSQFIKNLWHNRLKTGIFWLLSTWTFAFLPWSEARASLLGAMIVITLIILSPPEMRRSIKKVLLTISLTLLMTMTALLILPDYPRKAFLLKIWPQYEQEFSASQEWKTGKLQTIQGSNSKAVIQKIFKLRSAPDITTDQPRFPLWRDYGQILLKNPLGLGADYPSLKFIPYLNGEPANPQSTPLEVLALGGIISLIGYSWFWLSAFRNAFTKTKLDSQFIWIASLVPALALIAPLDSFSLFKPTWIILALATSL